MDKNILDYFPEDTEGFEKDDIIILAKTYDDNLEAQMAAALLKANNIPNFLISTAEESIDGVRLYMKQSDLESARIAIQELPERDKILPQNIRTINGYSPFRIMIYIFIAAIILPILIYYFSK